MTNKNAPQGAPSAVISGWIEAGLYVLAIAILSVVYAIANAAGAHAIVFILYSMVIAAIGLLLVTGLGEGWKRVVLHPLSWLVGASTIGLEITFCLTVGKIAPAESSLIVRSAIPFSILAGWTFFGRRPSRLAWVGFVIVLAGLGILVGILDLQRQSMGLVYGLLTGLLIVSRSFSGEFHPWNRSARTVHEKLRITGLIVLVTAVFGLVLAATTAALVAAGHINPSEAVPAPADFRHLPTFGLALVVGGALFTAMNYLQFSSVVKIQTENFIATSAFMPLVTFALQEMAATLGVLTPSPFDWRLLPAMALVIAGVIAVIIGNRRVA